MWGAEERESGGRATSIWRFLQFFNENNTFLGIFRLKGALSPNFLNLTR